MHPELSVILISKNQAWNVRRMIESVQRETAHLANCEILLVDSASSDGTTEIARDFPIGVIRLRDSQALTPAAGRYIGFKNTRGAFVLFLDGDMELCPFWLKKALANMKNRPEIAAITGERIDLPVATRPQDKPDLQKIEHDPGTLVEKGGGAALYRRQVLEKIGQFNPFLCSDEEPELCLRIRHNGYQILELEQTIVFHYSDPADKLATKFARRKRNLYLGGGQNLRYLRHTKYFWPYVKERDFATIPIVALIAGLVVFFRFLLTGEILLLDLWLAAFAGFFGIEVFRKKSFYLATGSLLHRAFIIEGTIRGFFKKTEPPANYPENFDWINPIAQPEAVS